MKKLRKSLLFSLQTEQVFLRISYISSVHFDILIIGGGHAGIEAANAAWKIGAKAAMLVFDKKSIGRMSCNPARGGVGKGQIVCDIDAMGGLMGLLADKAGIMFKMLNASKGPAVWGNRTQCDMDLYSKLAQKAMQNSSGLEIIEGEAVSIEKENGNWKIGTQSGAQTCCLVAPA